MGHCAQMAFPSLYSLAVEHLTKYGIKALAKQGMRSTIYSCTTTKLDAIAEVVATIGWEDTLRLATMSRHP